MPASRIARRSSAGHRRPCRSSASSAGPSIASASDFIALPDLNLNGFVRFILSPVVATCSGESYDSIAIAARTECRLRPSLSEYPPSPLPSHTATAFRRDRQKTQHPVERLAQLRDAHSPAVAIAALLRLPCRGRIAHASTFMCADHVQLVRTQGIVHPIEVNRYSSAIRALHHQRRFRADPRRKRRRRRRGNLSPAAFPGACCSQTPPAGPAPAPPAGTATPFQGSFAAPSGPTLFPIPQAVVPARRQRLGIQPRQLPCAGFPTAAKTTAATASPSPSAPSQTRSGPAAAAESLKVHLRCDLFSVQ